MTRLSDKEKAEAFEHICTSLHYARIAMNNPHIHLVLNAIDRYCRATAGEYTEEEIDERIKESFEALKKV